MPFSASALALTCIAIIIASSWCWLIALARVLITWNWLQPPARRRARRFIRTLGISPRLPLVAWSPRAPVPWALIDLVTVIGLYVLVLLIVGAGMRQFGWLPNDWSDPDKLALVERQRLLAANIASSMFVALGTAVLVSARSAARSHDFGIDWRYLASDLRLGLAGFVMLAPPVYAIQGLLVYLWKPSQHPLMEMFKESPDPGFFALLFVSAAIVAPLVEEFLFRVLLQGFLEKAAVFRGDITALIMGRQSTRGHLSIATTTDTLATTVFMDPNPYTPPQSLVGETAATIEPAEQSELRGPAAWGSIGIASAIFALLHYTHGPDWIPLFFLACGMGYLYQRTHRIIPSLTVHVLLNSLSMWALWVQVHSPTPLHDGP